jgi:hypothetical protein
VPEELELVLVDEVLEVEVEVEPPPPVELVDALDVAPPDPSTTS